MNASDIKPYTSLNSPSSDKSSLAIWVFVVIVLIAFALIIAVIYLSPKGDTTNKKDKTNQTEQPKEDSK